MDYPTQDGSQLQMSTVCGRAQSTYLVSAIASLSSTSLSPLASALITRTPYWRGLKVHPLHKAGGLSKPTCAFRVPANGVKVQPLNSGDTRRQGVSVLWCSKAPHRLQCAINEHKESGWRVCLCLELCKLATFGPGLWTECLSQHKRCRAHLVFESVLIICLDTLNAFGDSSTAPAYFMYSWSTNCAHALIHSLAHSFIHTYGWTYM